MMVFYEKNKDDNDVICTIIYANILYSSPLSHYIIFIVIGVLLLTCEMNNIYPPLLLHGYCVDQCRNLACLNIYFALKNKISLNIVQLKTCSCFICQLFIISSIALNLQNAAPCLKHISNVVVPIPCIKHFISISTRFFVILKTIR